MTALDLLLLSLATWRLAYMLTKEYGPFHVFTRLRTRFPLGGLTTCVKCASVWVAVGLFAIHLYTPYLTIVLAISGAALMLGSYSGVENEY